MTLPKFSSSRTPAVISVISEEDPADKDAAEVVADEEVAEDIKEDVTDGAKEDMAEDGVEEDVPAEDVAEEGVPQPGKTVLRASVIVRKSPADFIVVIFIFYISPLLQVSYVNAFVF
ncbi:MAG: hypothetical protein ACI4ET_14835 [Bilifractor sp.]